MGLGLPDFNINKELLKLAGVNGQEVRNLAPPKQLKMAIIPTHEPSNPMLTTLLLNPESLTETKAANWIQQNIPGQSDPLLQWVSGSSRTVTFTAKVTLDLVENYTVDSSGDSNIWSLEIEPELSHIREVTDSYNAAILDNLYNVSARLFGSDPSPSAPANQTAGTRWKQSIQPQLDFYRGLLVPRTGSLRNQLRTPPLVRLYMGKVLGGQPHSADQDFILASYSFNILQTTPELLPTMADVTFTFMEYSNQSKSITPQETQSVVRNQAVQTNALSKAPRVLGNVGGFGAGAA
jgi:hypothetical protein